MAVGAPVLVGMADLQVQKGGGLFTCVGLGSCIGFCALDPVTSVAGVVHVMLPEAFDRNNVDKIGKFADTGVPELLRQMEKQGAVLRRLNVALIGGAQVFKFGAPGAMPKMDVGLRNIEAVRSEVKKSNLKIVGEDVGGSLGRTLNLDISTGQIRVRTVSKGEINLCSLRAA